ncbi:uncharacterized protein EV420DRAFT_1695827 [Desarmillaria tabescens]|uniref:F-box domain-containing protein n=1 Tax=Armillaria tabescens TaxID=1929756 RepID=A0AA39K4A1_ARMTA|nr:uncharacterized protein EV420DRAFT_1695827 [Desarmillaria tabescens]KAK0454274.1 hypothetical protein EV420DRAFT_1695827 [Desarmillaria tabescens]
MPPSSSPKGGSYLEELPAELILEIVSCLDVPSIKKLSLASSTLHRICFPALFQYLFFYDFGDRTPRRFLSDMRRRCPVPCVRKLSFNDLRADVKSQALLKWCAAVREFEILSASNPKLYAPLLSGLGDLRAVELHRVTFQRVADFFELLRSLSATVKDLTIGNTIEFVSTSDNYPILPQTGRRIKVEKLVVSSCLVLELLLRDDSPVELSRLKVAETRYVTPSIINKLGYLNPRLAKLVIQDPALESNSESLVLPAVKHLTLSFRLSEWRSTPLRKLLNHSEVNLEELTIKLPFEVILEERGEWEGLALMLSRQSKLQGLKVVALILHTIAAKTEAKKTRPMNNDEMQKYHPFNVNAFTRWK